jgi:hypothetical protein
MTFDELQEIAEKDMKLDKDNLDIESLKIPELQHKYLKHYSKYNILLKQSETEYKILYRKKWEHYSGKGETPFLTKVLKQDMTIYLEADEELCKAKNKMEYYKNIIIYIEGILKSLNNRGFQIKNAIDWKKFCEGLN